MLSQTSAGAYKAAFHNSDIDTDTDIIARMSVRMSVSVSVSASWNAGYTTLSACSRHVHIRGLTVKTCQFTPSVSMTES